MSLTTQKALQLPSFQTGIASTHALATWWDDTAKDFAKRGDTAGAAAAERNAEHLRRIARMAQAN